MGHRKKSAPHRGSLGYKRKKSRKQSARWRNWPNSEKVRLQGFVGYKAGMTHIAMINKKRYSPLYKQELLTPVTVIETPPITIFAIRFYRKKSVNIDKTILKQIWAPKVDKDLLRRIKTPKQKINLEFEYNEVKNIIPQVGEIRVMAHTSPKEAGFAQKTPDVIEIKIGGSVNDAFEYAKTILGNKIEMEDVFEPGELLDVTGVTKGKGYQGPVKRHHIKILPRKTRKGRRVVACIGPWHPARVMWTVPRAGQLGYFARTEYNKMLLKISKDGEEVNPASGFKHYGLVKNHCLVEGSVPGPAKRLVRLREPIRNPKVDVESIELTYVSKNAKN